jgi:hypothetical protein
MTNLGEKRASIELHDSRLTVVVLSDESVIVQFRPAYVHCSNGRPGVDAGTGWVQDIDLVIGEPRIESSLSQFPMILGHGALSIGGCVFENVIPLPLDARGQAVGLWVEAINGERLALTGKWATTSYCGEPRYVEDFPGDGLSAASREDDG